MPVTGPHRLLQRRGEAWAVGHRYGTGLVCPSSPQGKWNPGTNSCLVNQAPNGVEIGQLVCGEATGGFFLAPRKHPPPPPQKHPRFPRPNSLRSEAHTTGEVTPWGAVLRGLRSASGPWPPDTPGLGSNLVSRGPKSWDIERHLEVFRLVHPLKSLVKNRV